MIELVKKSFLFGIGAITLVHERGEAVFKAMVKELQGVECADDENDAETLKEIEALEREEEDEATT